MMGVPLSTLKLNARILRDLDLISLIDHGAATLTPSGREVMHLLRSHLGQGLTVQEVTG